MFEGYKYTYRLNAKHYFKNTPLNVHSHTFEISLYIEHLREKDFVSFSIVDKIVQSFLLKYQNKVLNTIEPFEQFEPTIENMGNVFYEDLKEILQKEHFNLLQLEISETPLRLYIISDRLMFGSLDRRGD